MTYENALATRYSDVPLWQHMNKRGQSCLTMAAARGTKEMFSHILDKTKKFMWSYGPVTCVCYPLTGFDTPVNAKEMTRQYHYRKDQREILWLKEEAEEAEKEAEKEAEDEKKKDALLRDGGEEREDEEKGEDGGEGRMMEQTTSSSLRRSTTFSGQMWSALSSGSGTPRTPRVGANGHRVTIDRLHSTSSQEIFTKIKRDILQTAMEKSAIEEVVDNDRLDLMSLKRVDDLIQRKWLAFAYDIFKARLLFSVTYIFLMYFATTLPRWEHWVVSETTGQHELVGMQEYPITWEHSSRILRTMLELCVVGFTIWKATMEYQEVVHEGLIYHFTRSGAAVFENISSAVCIIVILCVTMSRVYGDDFLPLFGRANENAWMSIATLFAWINILWFLLGFQSTGPFVIMMQKNGSI